MGRPRKNASAQQLVVNLPGPEIEDVPTAGEVEADEEIAAAVDDSPRQAEATIFRLNADGQKAWCGKAAPAAVTSEFLAKRYGSGTYYVMFKKPSSDSRRMVYDRTKTYTIDAGADVSPQSSPVYDANGAVVNGRGADPMSMAGGAAVLSFIQQLNAGMVQQMHAQQANQQMMLQAVEKMMQPRESQMPAILATLAPLLPVLMERFLGPRESPLDVVEKVTALVRPASATKIEDMLESIVKMRELFSTLNGSGEEPDSMMKIVREGMETVRAVVAGNGQPMTPAAPPEGVHLHLNTEASAAAPALRVPVPHWMERLGGQFGAALAVRAFVSPADAANKLIDALTESEYLDECQRAMLPLEQYANDTFAALVAVNGRALVDEEMKWTATVVVALHEALQPSEDVEAAESGEE